MAPVTSHQPSVSSLNFFLKKLPSIYGPHTATTIAVWNITWQRFYNCSFVYPCWRLSTADQRADANKLSQIITFCSPLVRIFNFIPTEENKINSWNWMSYVWNIRYHLFARINVFTKLFQMQFFFFKFFGIFFWNN